SASRIAALPAGLEHVAHVEERVLELAAQGVEDSDDGDRNACGDEPVLDRGGARFVTGKALQQALHDALLTRSPRLWATLPRRRCVGVKRARAAGHHVDRLTAVVNVMFRGSAQRNQRVPALRIWNQERTNKNTERFTRSAIRSLI